MVKIFLIRPGSTDYDRQRRIQGTLDVPLNSEGEAEVGRLIEDFRHVKLDALYTAEGEPAQATAVAIAGALHVKLKKLDRFQNLDQGLWQGMLIDDVRLKQPKVYRQWQERPECTCPPDGEMLEHAIDRVRAVIRKLVKRHKEGTVGLVVPEPLASLVRWAVKRGELGDLWQASSEHGHWEMLEAQAEAPVPS